MSSMKNVYRRYALAGVTLSVAVSIGFFMQSSEPSYAGQSPTIPKILPVPGVHASSLQPQNFSGLSPEQKASLLPAPPADMAKDPNLPDQPVILIVSKDMPVSAMPEEEDTPILNCDATLTAKASAGAMVELSLSAPCLTGERVTVHHNGMKFSELVGSDGSMSITVPALKEQAVFVVSASNGDGAVATVEVSSLPFYDRVAVQWQGHGSLELHAREFDADYGSEGHVWHGAARNLTAVLGGHGGFLTVLGNETLPDANKVEVYTFPTGTAQNSGKIMLSVEAEVTSNNCGRDVTAQTIQLRDANQPIVRDIHLTVPDCDAKGEFLVLKNLLEDLTIASK